MNLWKTFSFPLACGYTAKVWNLVTISKKLFSLLKIDWEKILTFALAYFTFQFAPCSSPSTTLAFNNNKAMTGTRNSDTPIF